MRKNVDIGRRWLQSIGSVAELDALEAEAIGALVSKVKRLQDQNDEYAAEEKYNRTIRENPELIPIIGYRWDWVRAEVQRIKERRKCRKPYLKCT
jgi:hypothetical protein